MLALRAVAIRAVWAGCTKTQQFLFEVSRGRNSDPCFLFAHRWLCEVEAAATLLGEHGSPTAVP